MVPVDSGRLTTLQHACRCRSGCRKGNAHEERLAEGVSTPGGFHARGTGSRQCPQDQARSQAAARELIGNVLDVALLSLRLEIVSEHLLFASTTPSSSGSTSLLVFGHKGIGIGNTVSLPVLS